MKAIAPLALLLFAAPAAAQGLDPATVEGAYRHRFQNGNIDGQRYQSENILEVVRVQPDAAYIRMRLEFFNGHSCTMWGVARAEGTELVYRRPAAPGREACVLRLRFADGRVALQDENAQCRSWDCGARGGYQGITFPTASRRTITYMARLRASREFAEAMAEFEGSPPPR
jgi:hypothetical protein